MGDVIEFVTRAAEAEADGWTAALCQELRERARSGSAEANDLGFSIELNYAIEDLVDGDLPIDRLCDPTPVLYQHVVAGMHHFDYLQERERARARPAWDKQWRHLMELPEPERERLLRLMHTPMSGEVAAAHDADDEKVWRRALERAHRSGDLPAPGMPLF